MSEQKNICLSGNKSTLQPTARPSEMGKIFSYNGNSVTMRLCNGIVYVNLTEVAKSFSNKNLSQIINSQEIKEYCKALSEIQNCISTDLLIVSKGGDVSKQGTWAHQKVALRVAQKLSPVFSVWVDTKIEELLTTGVTNVRSTSPAHTMAEMPGLVSESLQRTAPIVESYGRQRVVSTVTLARLQGRSHEYVCASVRRMFKYVLRPGRQFIRKIRTVRHGNGVGYEREDGVMYYITIEGFNTMRKYCTSISDDVAEQVMRAFRDAKGKNRPQTSRTPQTVQEAKPQQLMSVTPNLPQTPADMMQRFVTAMAVMMGVDVNEVFNLMSNGGNK